MEQDTAAALEEAKRAILSRITGSADHLGAAERVYYLASAYALLEGNRQAKLGAVEYETSNGN